MRPIYPYNNPQNPESGYSESWNIACTGQYPNKVSKKTLDDAIGLVNFRGVLFLSNNFDYRPFIAPTNSKAYLYEGVVVIYSALKNSERFNVPPETLTVIAKTKEQIFKVAKGLCLPLEELVTA